MSIEFSNIEQRIVSLEGVVKSDYLTMSIEFSNIEQRIVSLEGVVKSGQYHTIVESRDS